MAHIQYTSEEAGRIGEEIYEHEIREQVEPQHRGKFVAIDIETGKYTLSEDLRAAVDELKAKEPNAVVFIMRAGYPTAFNMRATEGFP